ncbi:hypothetical protein D3C83_17260 [compost metagenome]
MTPSDDEGVKRVGNNPPGETVPEIQEVVDPVSQHVFGVHQPLQDPGLGPDELEMRIVIQGPTHRHLDKTRRLAEYGRSVEFDHIGVAHAVRRVIVPHHAAVVHESVLEKQCYGMRRQVPRRGTVTTCGAAGQLADALVGPDQLFFLSLAR